MSLVIFLQGYPITRVVKVHMDMDKEEHTSPIEDSTKLGREESKSPVQEIEEEPFVKVELKSGLEELSKSLKNGELNEIRSAYTHLTKTFPTAVKNIIKTTSFIFIINLEFNLVQLGSIRIR